MSAIKKAVTKKRISAEEFTKLTSADFSGITSFQKEISKIVLPNRITFDILADYRSSMNDFLESIREAGQSPFKDIAQMVNPLKDFQTNYLKEFLALSEAISNSIIPIGMTELINNLKTYQLEAIKGLIIPNELVISSITNFHGVENETKIIDANYLGNGIVSLDFEKTTSTISTEPVYYQKIETVTAEVELSESGLEKIERIFTDKFNKLELKLQAVLENSPQNMRITCVEYLPTFIVINKSINIKIPSKTHMDFICQVFFSSKKEKLTEEWFVDDLIEALEPFLRDADWENVTWKSIQDSIYKINEKFAIQTTKKDLFIFPRREVVRLNLLYF